MNWTLNIGLNVDAFFGTWEKAGNHTFFTWLGNSRGICIKLGKLKF